MYNSNQANIPILAFLKYGQHEHLKQLQQGKLFFNHLQYFAGCEQSDGRGDPYEQIYKQTKGKTVNIDLRELHDKSIKVFRDLAGNYTNQFINDEFHANIFCLYSVFSPAELIAQQIQLSQQMIGFGTHVLLILKPTDFIARVKAIIPSIVKKFHCSLVKYIDMQQLNGHKDYFEKPLNYSYQNEYRIAYQNDHLTTETFDIGSIEDISVLLKADECKGISFMNEQDAARNLNEIREKLINTYNQDLLAYTHHKMMSSENEASRVRLKALERKLLSSKDELETFAKSLRFHP